MREIVSINPATGEEIGRVPAATPEEIREKAAGLQRRRPEWRATSLETRIGFVRRAAGEIRRDARAISELMTTEQGKPMRESTAEVENSADRLDYFCDTAPAALAPLEEALPNGVRLVTRFEPVGVVGAIKPWNFPFGIPLWTIAPALIAGNVILFKPSERTPLLGRRIFEIFRDAGLPDGVMEIVQGGDDAGKAVVASTVDMISFVGSQAAGRDIMRKSSESLRRVVLELGGKDPMIVCADADFEKAVEGAVAGTFRNCGQVCCSVERVYVEKPIFEKFLASAAERTKRLKVGDGRAPGTEVGPMNREEEIRRVEEHLRDAVSKGARIVVGGRRIRGQFFEPTVITGVTDEMILAREETFGPVMNVSMVESVEEGVRKANALDFGLTASVWSGDAARAERIASELQAGTIAVNQSIGSIVQAPWGGVKASGTGRMLGPEAAREFTNPVSYRFPGAAGS